ncbi:nucleoside diphosphate kinase regulator protein, putative [Pedobacter sp. BAL39]|uniref:GreA/GreB family elongation factor n=1 Tax=Pedobacter sp. BAL39 TaxID=391596 RepID=UPI000155AD6A|nr:GreA/GreB family elongation factor [Pedobacter sp. BAL39]EDM34741.1 nucleoside diphosphate kinase regulator protein, putative [Pedobacter sp. BAL39]
MNLSQNNQVVITADDYQLLKPYFTKTNPHAGEMSLSAELSRAVILSNEEFPSDAIRLNSTVRIQDESTGEIMELIIVLPQHANIKEKKISVLTPIAAALIGFRQGDAVQWKVPAGLKNFRITEVAAPGK